MQDLLNNPGNVTVNKTALLIQSLHYKYTVNYNSAFQLSSMEVTQEGYIIGQCSGHLGSYLVRTPSFGFPLWNNRLPLLSVHVIFRWVSTLHFSLWEGTRYSSHFLVPVIYLENVQLNIILLKLSLPSKKFTLVEYKFGVAIFPNSWREPA